MRAQNFFPLNDTLLDPNSRGTNALGLFLCENITFGEMTAGAATVTVKAPFGKGLGEVIGAILTNTAGGNAVTAFTPDANPILSISAAAGSNAGEVDVTIKTTDATATTASHVRSFFLVGRVLPIAVS